MLSVELSLRVTTSVLLMVRSCVPNPDNVPDTPDEWLERFNTFSVYQILPQLIELWGLNIETQVESKKNIARLTAK